MELDKVREKLNEYKEVEVGSLKDIYAHHLALSSEGLIESLEYIQKAIYTEYVTRNHNHPMSEFGKGVLHGINLASKIINDN